MSQELDIIKRVKAEHEVLRGHVKLVGDSISDREAAHSLQGAHTEWIPGRLELVAEKQKALQRTLAGLEEGLARHFSFEERVLPPLLGELLARALAMEHREIAAEIGGAISMAASMTTEGLGREEAMAQDARIQQAVDGIGHLVGEHAAREEALLDMLERALEGGVRPI